MSDVRVGQIVRVESPDSSWHGQTGTVLRVPDAERPTVAIEPSKYPGHGVPFMPHELQEVVAFPRSHRAPRLPYAPPGDPRRSV